VKGISLVYGYVVCLLATAAIAFAVLGLVNGIFAYERPLTNASWNGTSLSSYESFRATYDSAPLPAEDRLRAEYAARREDAIEGARADAHRAIVGDAVLLLVAFIVLRFHWQWLQRISLASAW
jgi:hypothetical protein